MNQKTLYLAIGLLIGIGSTVLFNLFVKTSAQEFEDLPKPFYNVLFENENVRVIDHVLNPGETEPFHNHPPMYVYFLEDSDVTILDTDGNETLESLKKDQNFIAPALSHSIVNTGNSTLHSILVELK